MGHTTSLSPVVLSPESLPPLVYKDQPVITSKTLSVLYGTDPSRIRDNFRKQRERFVAGKHFFKVEGNELKHLKECVSLRHSVSQARALTLWTARGAARHAKMLDTDKAWEVFELLEDNYFSPKTAPKTQTLTPSTANDRRALNALVKSWARSLGGGSNYSSCYRRVSSHFNLESISELPVEWIADATAWINEQMNLAVTALPEAPAATAPVKQDTLEWLRGNFPGVPDDPKLWHTDLMNRALRAFNSFHDEIEAIRKDARSPFLDKRQGIAFGFDGLLAVADNAIRVAADTSRVAYRNLYLALEGYTSAWVFLTYGNGSSN